MLRFLNDARLALRGWAKTPGLALIAVASIGLGIGANTAIFTLVDQVLLRPLPVEKPEELVQLTPQGSLYGSNWGDGTELSYPTYVDLRDHNEVFSGVFCRFGYPLHVGFDDRTERVAGEIVSGSYFPVLGVRAAVGRTLAPDDDRTIGGHPVAVLAHGFWVGRFGADPGVVGRDIVVNGHGYTVVGVAQRGFEGVELGRPAQLFVPVTMKAQLTPGWNALDQRAFRWVRVFGRLRPGIRTEQAQAALQPLFRARLEVDLADPGFARASAETRSRYLESRVVLLPGEQGRSSFRRGLSTPLWVLMGTAAGVLLIACANVANLLLARGAARQREMALRLALGATRRRLVQQLLAESLLLAFAGGLAGVAIAAFGAPAVLALFADPEAPGPVSASPDLRIMAFTFAVSAFTGILFGLLPALRSSRPDLAPTLKAQAGSVLGGAQARFRKALVASQVTVSLLLVIGAGLFLRTLHNLMAVDVGFDTRSLISFTVDPGLNGHPSERVKALSKSLLERLTATPGFESATFASMPLLDGSRWTADVTVEGYRRGPDEDTNQHFNTVAPGYFHSMGIPLIAGREFDARDERLEELPEEQAPRQWRVAVVNQSFVRRFFGSGDPLGRRLGLGTDPGTPTPIEIVGVVADSSYADVRDEVPGQVFLPFLETSRTRGFTVYARTALPPAAAFEAARRAVKQLDSNLPVARPRTLDQQVRESVGRERMVATMSSVFGALATLLAVVGLYGVMSYTVARRTREIGIRMALGAGARDVSWLVVREVLAIAVAGVAAALLIAFWLGRLVASQLYGVTATDPATMAAAAAGLLLVSLLAGLIPSRRAARVEPTTALRDE